MPSHSESSRASHARTRPFIPAAGHDFLLPLYDPLTNLLGGGRVRARLLYELTTRPGDRVLDLGAGTGALTLALKREQPGACIVGVDPDPKALARARRKAQQAGLDIEFREAYGDALPFPDASFQHAVSSLVLHHLTSDEKAAALREVHRVLASGGTLRVLDFGPAHSRVQRLLSHLFHADAELADNLAGRIPQLFGAAGFAGVREVGWWGTLFGPVSLYAGEKPA